jgi:hypothetical protein
MKKMTESVNNDLSVVKKDTPQVSAKTENENGETGNESKSSYAYSMYNFVNLISFNNIFFSCFNLAIHCRNFRLPQK